MISLEGLINNRYQIANHLGTGGMGIVYRAYDRLTQRFVAIKRVLTDFHDLILPANPTQVRSNGLLLTLAQEFRFLATLRHPNVISVLDYGFDSQGHPYFTMELLEEAQTIVEAARYLSSAQNLDLLIQLLQALTYLHLRGILHRDLKPENVLVSQGCVRVLDFGLSVMYETHTPSNAGTLRYMAPELYSGQASTIASDLYSVGVIAYEMFCGQPPFPLAAVDEFFVALFENEPDLAPLVAHAPALAPIIGRLLARQPEARYQQAQAVISAIFTATQQVMPSESLAIRDSFLQTAPFVGRQAEMERLSQALAEVGRGKGSAWLVGGESGIGKSRLLGELRIRALVEGVLVLQGQAVESGGLSYQLWREPLRWLALSTDLTPLEASVLKEIIPDIATLIGQPVNDAPELSGEARQQRLLYVLVAVCRRQTRPLLFLLEDLQWAGGSLNLLRYFLRFVADLPVLLVASYRDDEAPALISELPGTQSVKLARLQVDEIAALSGAMLGEIGRHSSVIDLLTRETEGNIFFIIEVVRVLAEKAGGLGQIEHGALPQQVLAGGVQQLLRRRLERVPAPLRHLLNLAAVAGRYLDLLIIEQLLATFSPPPGPNSLENWLIACAGAAVLEVYDNRWRFTHDKLRATLLNDLDTMEKADLHQQVAQAIEQVYPEPEARNTYAEALTEHWRQAGHVSNEFTYLFKAVQQLLYLSTDLRRAQQLAEHGMARLATLQPPNVNQWQGPLLNLLGESTMLLGEYDRAQNYYQQGLAIAQQMQDQATAANLLVNLSRLCERTGNYEVAIAYAEQGIVAAQLSDAHAIVASGFNSLGNLAQIQGNDAQAYHYFQQSLALRRALDDQRGIASCLNNLGLHFESQGDHQAAQEHYVQSLTIRQATGDQLGIADSLNNLANVATIQGDYTLARDHYQQSLTIRRTIGDLPGIVGTLYNLGYVIQYQGDWEAARESYQQSLSMAREIGAWDLAVLNLNNLAIVHTKLQQEATAQQMLQAGLTLAEQLGITPLKLVILTAAIHWMAQQGKWSLVTQWLGVLSHHPQSNLELMRDVAEAQQAALVALGEKEFATALELGSQLDLNQVLAEISVDKSR